MTATPTREELVAAVATALLRLSEAQPRGHYVPGSIRGAIRRATQRLAAAEAALANHDAVADWALVRKLLDEHCVVWAWHEGIYICRLGLRPHAAECGTGATRSEALVDLARKVAALDIKPAGEAGEERAT